MKLVDLGMTLEDIDLGGFDAESDPGLDDYLVKTRYVNQALTGKRFIFKGRKGAGKSAIFTQVDRLASEKYGKDVLTISLTPEDYAWNVLKGYRESGLSVEQAHVSAWKMSILVEVAAEIASSDRNWGPLERDSVKRLQKFIRENVGEHKVEGKLQSTATFLRLDSVSLRAFGIAGSVSLGKAMGTTSNLPGVASVLLKEISVVANAVKIIVAIDRLDDAWDGSPESRSLLVGLFKVCKDLNDHFRLVYNNDLGGLLFVAFIRSDIYESLDFDDRDKLRPFEVEIVWTKETLADMVSSRLPDDVNVEDLFVDDKMRGGTKPFDYLVRRTFLRPREVLQYLYESMEEALSDKPYACEVSKDHLRAAETRFSESKVADLKQEYKKSEPALVHLIDGLRHGPNRYDSIEELERHLALTLDEVGPEIRPRSELDAVKLLYASSAIGFRTGNSGSPTYRSSSPQETLPQRAQIYVHQALKLGLGIKEPRKRAEGSQSEG